MRGRVAYAVLAGGGVKGAALAGCLRAAEQLGVEFAGYGGSSAGAIVSLLACAGCSGERLRDVFVNELDPIAMTDDSGARLRKLRLLRDAMQKPTWRTARLLLAVVRSRKALGVLQRELGVYHTRGLRRLLDEHLRRTLPGVASDREVTFHDLKERARPILKIVSTDINLSVPLVHSSAGADASGPSVLDAVCASACYPFMFQPVRTFGDRRLVDGGLASNLPVWVFAQEQERTGHPIIAFDLVQTRSTPIQPYRLPEYCGDLLMTSLQTGDRLVRQVMPGVIHVKVPIPDNIGPLDLWIDAERRQALFDAGFRAAEEQLRKNLSHWFEAGTDVQILQAKYAPPQRVEPLLRAAVDTVKQMADAGRVGAFVCVPDGAKALRAIYRYSSSIGAEPIPLADPVTRGWTEKSCVYQKGKGISESRALAGRGIECTYAAPIVDLTAETSATSMDDLPKRGLLVVECSKVNYERGIVDATIMWSDVLSKVLQ